MRATRPPVGRSDGARIARARARGAKYPAWPQRVTRFTSAASPQIKSAERLSRIAASVAWALLLSRVPRKSVRSCHLLNATARRFAARRAALSLGCPRRSAARTACCMPPSPTPFAAPVQQCADPAGGLLRVIAGAARGAGRGARGRLAGAAHAQLQRRRRFQSANAGAAVARRARARGAAAGRRLQVADRRGARQRTHAARARKVHAAGGRSTPASGAAPASEDADGPRSSRCCSRASANERRPSVRAAPASRPGADAAAGCCCCCR